MKFEYDADGELVDVEQEVNVIVEFEIEVSGTIPMDERSVDAVAAEVLDMDEKDVVVSTTTVDGEQPNRGRSRVPIDDGVRTYLEGSMLVRP